MPNSFIHELLSHFLAFLCGLIDSFRFKRVAEYFLASRTIRKAIFSCLLLNAVLFLGLIISYELFMSYLVQADNFLGHFLRNFQLLFQLIYYPILTVTYLVSFIMSSFWFGDIAEEAISIERRLFENKNFVSRNIDFATRVTNEIYRIFLVIFFFIQITLLGIVPIVGPLMKILHLSFLYSLYCFEYKWGTDSYLMKNLAFFEVNFAYFMGFGFVFAVSTNYFPFLLSTGLYAVFFPFFLLTAIRATPPIFPENFTLKELLYRRNWQYAIIKKFEYNEEKYEETSRFKLFFFCRRGIRAIQSLIEKLVEGKL